MCDNIILKKSIVVVLLMMDTHFYLFINVVCAPLYFIDNCYIYIYLLISLTVYIFIYLFIYLPIHLSLNSKHRQPFPTMHKIIFLSFVFYQFIYLSIYLSVYLSIYLSICLSIYLSISPLKELENNSTCD